MSKVHEKDSMFFRVDAGEAKCRIGGKEHMYELSTNVGGSNPIVRSAQTGKWFVLSWNDIIQQAIAAGVDK